MTQQSQPALDEAAVKAAAMLSYDLAMLSTARRYNLDERADRDDSNRALTRLFFDLTSITKIDLFVELGAREASASRRARKWFKGLRVVAFEANPVAYARYAETLKEAGIEYVNLALTDVPGQVTFNLHRDEDGTPVDNGQSSLLKRDKAPIDRERGFEEIAVDGIPLDTFFAGYEFDRAAVWIDVEGACGYVLPGARAVLSRAAVVIIEVEDQNYWGDGHWLREQVVSYLYDLGLVPVARDYEYEHQHNIVFVRADLLRGATRVRAALARFVSKACDPPWPSPPASPAPLKAALPKAAPPKAAPPKAAPPKAAPPTAAPPKAAPPTAAPRKAAPGIPARTPSAQLSSTARQYARRIGQRIRRR